MHALSSSHAKHLLRGNSVMRMPQNDIKTVKNQIVRLIRMLVQVCFATHSRSVTNNSCCH